MTGASTMPWTEAGSQEASVEAIDASTKINSSACTSQQAPVKATGTSTCKNVKRIDSIPLRHSHGGHGSFNSVRETSPSSHGTRAISRGIVHGLPAQKRTLRREGHRNTYM